jgi:hypothetical protein
MSVTRRLPGLGLLLALLAPSVALAETAPFDLTGPSLRIEVARDGVTLPIAKMPDISPGDRISIKAELSPTQSARYLLVAAFLRGPINPPPESWFSQEKIWDKKARAGLTVTVPKGAQQVLIFLAPQTEGDYKTLVATVRSRPGAFVRADQDLTEAALERARLDAFFAAVNAINQADPDELKTLTPTLAHSLGIKLKSDCLDQATDLQAPCLTQGQDALVIDANHTSIIQALTSGDSATLMQQLSGSTANGAKYVSPYVSSLIDLAHVFESMRTAHYQYIPTLGLAHGDLLSLKINTPPSFSNPKSVLVVALPTADLMPRPRLRAADPSRIHCAQQTSLVLTVDGAPLIFATDYAHDLALRLTTKTGKIVKLPVRPDPARGGLVVDTRGLAADDFGDVIDGSLHGAWGFESFSGPAFRLHNSRPESWTLAADDRRPLVVGRDTPIHLEAPGTACVASVRVREPSGDLVATSWKVERPGVLAVALPIDKAQPGAAALLITRYGSAQPSEVPVQIFAAPSRLDGFVFHAGDRSGLLKGRRLDEVGALTLAGIDFKPAQLTKVAGDETLAMVATDAKAIDALEPGAAVEAKVTLKDGRRLDLRTSVESARPSVVLIAKNVAPPSSDAPDIIQLASGDDLPRGARLTFSLRAQAPAAFSDGDSVEVGGAGGSVLTTLTLANGLTLADPHVAVATLDTGKAFNASQFGPLQFRTVIGGVAGDWRPLATLVRLPTLSGLDCPARPGQPCELRGADLYLIDSVSDDPAFAHAVKVADGFPGNALSVPRPASGRLYLKLHDDPSAVDHVAFPRAKTETLSKPAAVSDAPRPVEASISTRPAG